MMVEDVSFLHFLSPKEFGTQKLQQTLGSEIFFYKV